MESEGKTRCFAEIFSTTLSWGREIQVPELGKRLRTIREEKGLTLEDAGELLNIKFEDLKALEEEDFLFFPDRQFAWTVLEIYATFLGMNKEEVNWEFSELWSEYGPLKRLFKKPKKRKKEILATETAEIPAEPEILEENQEPEDIQKPPTVESHEESGEPEELQEEELLKYPEEEWEPEPFPSVLPGDYPDMAFETEISEEEPQGWQSIRDAGLPEEILVEPAAQDSSSKKKFTAVAVGLLVVALAAFGVWQFTSWGGKNNGPQENKPPVQAEGEGENPEQSEQLEEAPSSKPEQTGGEVPEQVPPPSLKPDEVTTQAVKEQSIRVSISTPNGECWVEVVADGEQVYYRLVPPDTEPLVFEAEDEMSVLIGDAAAARLNVNGEDLGTLGSRYVVIQKVFTSEQ